MAHLLFPQEVYYIVDISTIFYFSKTPYTFLKVKRVVIEIISYAPLWETMQQKGISQYYLLQHGIDNKTLDSIKKNKNITLLTLEKLCRLIECTPNDIVEFK